MKEQLTELLKKANEGVSATPTVVKSLIQQYQVAHIGYLIINAVVLAMCLAVIIYVFVSMVKRKEWAVSCFCGDNELVPSVFSGTIMVISAVLAIGFFIAVLCNAGPAFSPAWYMLKDLMN